MSERRVGEHRPHRAARPTRLINVDALRGLALLGILVVNIWAFADPFYATASSNPFYDSKLDHATRFLVALFFETKFYLLFSFLFGYSFTLQMTAAEHDGKSLVPRMMRRQIGLLVIGLAHGAMLFYGDILSTYAILGLILLACRNFSPARSVRIGVGLIAISGIAWIVLGWAIRDYGGTPGAGVKEAAEKLVSFTGNANATLDFHFENLPRTIEALALLQAPSAMAMFFLGFAAGRKKLFATLTQQNLLMRRVMRYTLPIGLLGAFAYAIAAVYSPGSGAEVVAIGISQLTAPLLAASYVIGSLLLFQTRFGSWIARALAPPGRIALTNYLAQSLTLGILFTGYGFRLVDSLAPFVVLASVSLVFAAQIVLSRWWLSSHAYGPAEWMLRALTIGKIPPWRKSVELP